MDWQDAAIVLAVRPYGESAAVASVLTRTYGRHSGLVRAAASQRNRGVWQPGNSLALSWRGRLEEHLGNFTAELAAARAARVLDDGGRLAALAAACALVDAVLPERAPHPGAHDALAALLDGLPAQGWACAYLRWELDLLAALGFGLDLTCCAATGRNDQLAYVSPKSGRAVSLSAGAPYADRLLPLPAFLLGSDADGAASAALPDAMALRQGFALTGFFLDREVFRPEGKALPAARTLLAERVGRG